MDSAVADASPSGDDAFCDAGSKRMMKHAEANAARTDRESPGAQDPFIVSESAAKSNVPLNAAKALNHVPLGNVLPFTNSKRGTNLTLR